MTPLVQVSSASVTFSRGIFPRRLTQALIEVDLTVAPGEAVGLVGESGCGKSTLARLMLGLVDADQGEVQIMGRRVSRRSRPDARDVQMIYQNVDAHVDPRWTVRRLLEESARVHGRRKSDVEASLTHVELGHRADVRAGRLSGGERRRLGVARVLLARPKLLVADEPCAGVDAARRLGLASGLLAGRGDASGLVLITHDLGLVQAVCDRVVVMLGGRAVEACDTSALGLVPHHPYTRVLLAASGLIDEAVSP